MGEKRQLADARNTHEAKKVCYEAGKSAKILKKFDGGTDENPKMKRLLSGEKSKMTDCFVEVGATDELKERFYISCRFFNV